MAKFIKIEVPTERYTGSKHDLDSYYNQYRSYQVRCAKLAESESLFDTFHRRRAFLTNPEICS
jgi:hypothetical protein